MTWPKQAVGVLGDVGLSSWVGRVGELSRSTDSVTEICPETHARTQGVPGTHAGYWRPGVTMPGEGSVLLVWNARLAVHVATTRQAACALAG